MAFLKYSDADQREHCVRHNRAVVRAFKGGADPGSILVRMLQDWYLRARHHQLTYGPKALLGKDDFGGKAWIEIGLNLRVLLSMQTNNELDHGMLDSFVVGTINQFGGTVK